MKGLLLDTHAFLWFALGNAERLPSATVDLINDAGSNVFLSAASIWEIATKSRIGKIAGVEDIALRPSSYLSNLGINGLAVSIDHASRAGSFDVAHRDPFDRMLAAQSLLEGLGIVSVDKVLDEFGVERLWRQ